MRPFMKVITIVAQEVRTSSRVVTFFGLTSLLVVVAAVVLLNISGPPISPPQQLVSPSSLYDILGDTTWRTRTHMIGYGVADNYTNTLGWEYIAENFNPHIGCRGNFGIGNLLDNRVRVDDYHSFNPDGKMVAYENTLFEWRAPTTNIARDETAWLHVGDPARLRLTSWNDDVHVYWSDDARGNGGGTNTGNTYLRGEGLTFSGYNVYRATNAGGPYTKLNASPIPYQRDEPAAHLDTGMEYVDETATPGVTYYYKIMTLEGASERVFSGVQSVQAVSNPKPALVVTSVDVREATVVGSGSWTYTLTFVVDGNPDSVQLSFDEDRDHVIESPDNGQGFNEILTLNETVPGSGEYAASHTFPASLVTGVGYGFFVTAVKGGNPVRAPISDFFTTTINNRVQFKGWGGMLFDRTNVTFQNYFISEMQRHISAQDLCDGTFGDVVSFDPSYAFDVPVPSFSQPQWEQQFIAWLDAVDDPANGVFILNTLPTVAQLAAGMGNISDGFLSEGFSVYGSNRHWTSWIRGELNAAITAQQQYAQPVFLTPRIRDADTAEGTKDREYGFAAYNIARENRAYYYASDETLSYGYEHPEDFPEYSLHLGEPVDTTTDGTVTPYQLGSGYPQNNLLRRKFVSGVAVMNIMQPVEGTPSQTIPLGGTYYRVNFVGTRVRQGGSLQVDPAPVTQVTLGPAEGAVFVSSPQLPACIEEWTCTPWSICSDNQQTRECSDAHECGTTTNRPPLTQACDSTPPIISNITVSNVTQTSATVNWTTNELSNSRVEYGTTPSYGQTTLVNPAMVLNHSVPLTGLSHSTLYHFRIHSIDGSNNAAASTDQTFTTATCTENWTCLEWGPCVGGQQTRSCSDSNLCGTTNNRPPLTQACDSTPPTVSITSPSPGATVAETTPVTASASDNVGVAGVQFKIDSVNLGAEDLSDPYAIDWDTTTVADGSHVLTAVARDTSDNTTTSAPVPVTVDNPEPDTDPPIISDIAVSDISQTGATVTWTTNELSNSRVEYGLTVAYGQTTILNPTMVFVHSESLVGLTQGTLYHFRVHSVDGSNNAAVSSDQTFTTATCTENWECDPWGPCVAGQQTRPCRDLNQCGTTNNRPPLTQACDSTSPTLATIRATDITGTGAIIRWTTDEPATAQVEIGRTTDYGQTTLLDPLLRDDHDVLIGNLSSGTNYHFRVRSQDSSENLAVSGDQTFETASEASPPAPPPEQPPPSPPEPLPICSPSWSCTEWSVCANGMQTRECTDANQCGSESGRPELSQLCGAGGSPSLRASTEILVGPAAPGAPHLRRFSPDGRILGQFFAYARTFRGGVNVTSGDVDGDGTKEIITGAGPGGSSHIRVFSAAGQLHSQFFAFPRTWRTGGSVVALDLNGDGQDEIAVAPNSGAAHIRVFRYDAASRSYVLHTQRFAYDTRFRGGVHLAAGDLDGDGAEELLTAPAGRGGPHVRVFRYNSATNALDLFSQFFAYPGSFTTGVSLAVGDVDGDGAAEILTGSGPDRDPVVRVFTPQGNRIVGFLAGSTGFRGGVWVASVQADDDPAEEIVMSTWRNGRPDVVVVDVGPSFGSFTPLHRFTAYPLPSLGVRLSGF